MPDIISRLLPQWADAGAQPTGGVTEEEIEAFQRTQPPNAKRPAVLIPQGQRDETGLALRPGWE
jgi:hypothetical protein